MALEGRSRTGRPDHRNRRRAFQAGEAKRLSCSSQRQAATRSNAPGYAGPDTRSCEASSSPPTRRDHNRATQQPAILLRALLVDTPGRRGPRGGSEHAAPCAAARADAGRPAPRRDARGVRRVSARFGRFSRSGDRGRGPGASVQRDQLRRLPQRAGRWRHELDRGNPRRPSRTTRRIHSARRFGGITVPTVLGSKPCVSRDHPLGGDDRGPPGADSTFRGRPGGSHPGRHVARARRPRRPKPRRCQRPCGAYCRSRVRRAACRPVWLEGTACDAPRLWRRCVSQRDRDSPTICSRRSWPSGSRRIA